MTVPVLTFFNGMGGMGTNWLVFHVAWALSDAGRRVLVCDVDPQAGLTGAILSSRDIAALWDGDEREPTTIHRCVSPRVAAPPSGKPVLKTVKSDLFLLPGDVALAALDETLAWEWAVLSERGERKPDPGRLLSFWTVAQRAAVEVEADLVVFNAGQGLGGINRTLVSVSDHLLVPLHPDVFSVHMMKVLGPKVRAWRSGWNGVSAKLRQHGACVPNGGMRPIGYVLRDTAAGMTRVTEDIGSWSRRIPAAFRHGILDDRESAPPSTVDDDPYCLARLKHFWSLAALGEANRKPVFALTPADGAIGIHAAAVRQAAMEFQALARTIIDRIALSHA